MQKTHFHAFKLFSSFKIFLINAYQDKNCKAWHQTFCYKTVLLACQRQIFIWQINHSPKSSWICYLTIFFCTMWFCFSSHWMLSQVWSSMKSQCSRGQKKSKSLNRKLLQMVSYNIMSLSNTRTLWKVELRMESNLEVLHLMICLFKF